jgi:hypothetical protein
LKHLQTLASVRKFKPHIVFLDIGWTDYHPDNSQLLETIQLNEILIANIVEMEQHPAVVYAEMVMHKKLFYGEEYSNAGRKVDPFGAQRFHAAVAAYHRIPLWSMNNLLDTAAWGILTQIDCFKHAYGPDPVKDETHPQHCIHQLMADIIAFNLNEVLSLLPPLASAPASAPASASTAAAGDDDQKATKLPALRWDDDQKLPVPAVSFSSFRSFVPEPGDLWIKCDRSSMMNVTDRKCILRYPPASQLWFLDKKPEHGMYAYM